MEHYIPKNILNTSIDRLQPDITYMLFVAFLLYLFFEIFSFMFYGVLDRYRHLQDLLYIPPFTDGQVQIIVGDPHMYGPDELV